MKLLIITTLLLSSCAHKVIVHDCNPVVTSVDTPNDWVCENYWYSK